MSEIFTTKRKVFISYHHGGDQYYKDELLRLNVLYDIFIDRSVDTGHIPDDWDDQRIRSTIRDNYLRDSTVTILLVGRNTAGRKHVDWEIYSSMYNGAQNKKSGLLVIELPEASLDNVYASRGEEKTEIYSEYDNWVPVETKAAIENRHPYLPSRIIENLETKEALISITTWSRVISNPEVLRYLIDITSRDRAKAEYYLGSPMRRHNAPIIL